MSRRQTGGGGKPLFAGDYPGGGALTIFLGKAAFHHAARAS
jgi:hypothetical protein